MWNDQDLKQMEAKGITTAQIDRQLERFAQGFPWLHIETAATVENGKLYLYLSDSGAEGLNLDNYEVADDALRLGKVNASFYTAPE